MRLSESLAQARERAGLNPLKVQIVSETESRLHGEDFYVNNTTVRRYEEGGQPSPAKLLTLARIYRVPLSEFFRAIGATDAEICGHAFSEEEQRFISLLKSRPENARLHQALQSVLEAGSPEDQAMVRRMIEVIAERQPSAPSTVPAVAPKPEEKPRKAGAEIIPFIQLVDHDEPQELRMEELPYFEWASVPAGPPDFQNPDGTVTMPVLRHLAKGGRFVIRVTGDSMEPEIHQGDLLIVDTNIKFPRHGDTVVALINQRSTLKKFVRKHRKITLHPLNPSHDDIPVTEKDEFLVQGVVVAITREMRK